MKIQKPIAVISMVRNDSFFTEKWISYYGKHLGFEHLYLFLDGMDQKVPEAALKINYFQIPHKEESRAQGDRNRAKIISKFAQQLFPKYHAVLAVDIDEFLVLDPKMGDSFKTYLQQEFKATSLSGLGLDVGQHPNLEAAIDLKKSFLSQRSFAQVSDRYTKPSVSFKPISWGAGFHRIKGKNFKIDSNLFLFHFGLIDHKTSLQKSGNKELLKMGWKSHFDRRKDLYKALKTQIPMEASTFFPMARNYFTKNRKWYAWNKPAPIRGANVIKIPKHFQTLV